MAAPSNYTKLVLVILYWTFIILFKKSIALLVELHIKFKFDFVHTLQERLCAFRLQSNHQSFFDIKTNDCKIVVLLAQLLMFFTCLDGLTYITIYLTIK